jgi:hypothetical protein
MNERMFPDYGGLYRRWSRVLKRLAWDQWRLLDAQYQTGLSLWSVLFGPAAEASAGPGRAGGVSPKAPPEDIERVALERVRRGLPPPGEVYDIRNRQRIDWSRFPEWARPSDPEAFEGSAHEG